MNSVGSSRLATASGPGTQPLVRGLSTAMPGSPLKQ